MRRILCAIVSGCALIACTAGALHGQAVSWIQQDVGAPPTASVWNSASGEVTTSTRGLSAVSGGDEIAFTYQSIARAGSIERVQPLASGWIAGRTEGIAIRQSTAPGSPSVFWGLKANGSGVPKLVLQWRKTLDGASLSTEVNDTPLRSTTGELKLRLQWFGHQAVASYYAHADSAWRPLYAIEVSSGQSALLAGAVHASGTSAPSWVAQVPSVNSVVPSQPYLTWEKVSEPQLSGIAARPTTVGYSYLYTFPQAPEDWSVASDASAVGGDTFYRSLDSSYLTSVGMESISSRAQNTVEVFMRWGDVAGSTASSSVGVEVWDAGNVAFTKTVNQQRDVGLWVHLGTLPAQEHDIHIYVDGPASSSGHVALDGVLLLSQDNGADADYDGLPDDWENYTVPGTGLNPDDDDDGDGLTNSEEYVQMQDPLTRKGLYADSSPDLARVGAEERRVPMGMPLITPLQVIAKYPGTNIPIKGFRLEYVVPYYAPTFLISPHLEIPGSINSLIVRTGADGVASGFVTMRQINAPTNATLAVKDALSSNAVNFTLIPYVNHDPGPVDFHPASAALAPFGSLPIGGKAAAMGTWIAVAQPGVSGVTEGKVNLYRWESSENAWKPSFVLSSPSTSPLVDGYAADLRMNEDVLAVHASGDQKVHLYELNPHSEHWELKSSIPASGSLTDFAVSKIAVALADRSLDQVKVFKRTSAGWQISTPQNLEPTPTRALEIDFGARAGFSRDGAALWVGAPAHATTTLGEYGEVAVYTRNSGGTWVLNSTIAGGTGSEVRAFGASVDLLGNTAYIGAPALPGVAGIGDFGRVYQYEKSGSVWGESEEIDGASADFGKELWAMEEHLLVAAHDSIQATVPGTVWNRISLYRRQSGGHVFVQDQALPTLAGTVEGNSVFLTPAAAPAQTREFRLAARLDSQLANGSVVGWFDFFDADNDLHAIELLQPWELWGLDLTALPELKVASSSNLLLAAGTVQWFNLRLQDLAGSVYEESFQVQVQGQPPGVPTGVEAKVVGVKAVDIAWVHDGVGDPTFRIERAVLPKNTLPTGAETFQSVGLAPAWSRHHTDESVTALQDYAFRTRAEGAAGISAYSAVAVLHWDADNDNIPDWWEAAFGGGDLDPTLDPDGDGKTNLQEYTAGTNPTLLDSDGDGSPDQSDSKPLDATINPVGLQIFTRLAKP